MIAFAIFFKWAGLFLGILGILGLGTMLFAWWYDRRVRRRIARESREHGRRHCTDYFTRHRLTP